MSESTQNNENDKNITKSEQPTAYDKWKADLEEGCTAAESFAKKWKEFQQRFDAVNKAFLTKLQQGLEVAAFEPDTTERNDGKMKMKTAVSTTVDLIKKSKRIIIMTGAGVSTSAGICDYRGPKGKWTLEAKGQTAKSKPVHSLVPTFTHMAIKALLDNNMIFSVVSSNIDGLHRYSGIPDNNLNEVHGNFFKEVCTNNTCALIFERPFPVRKAVARKNKLTGGICEKCGSKLRDTIVNFGDNLNEKEWNQTIEDSTTCDLIIVLGSSITVNPSALLPRQVSNSGGDIVIVNKQKTPFDHIAKIKLHYDIDIFMTEVMRVLGVSVKRPPDQRKQYNPTEKIAWRVANNCSDPNFTIADDEEDEQPNKNDKPPLISSKPSSSTDPPKTLKMSCSGASLRRRSSVVIPIRETRSSSLRLKRVPRPSISTGRVAVGQKK